MAPVFSHGDLRLYLLSLLDEGPRHGYDIMQALSDRTGGTYTPSAGTIYPRLAKLEEEGLVTKTVDGRKTVYEITDAGRAEVASRAGDLEGIEAGLTDSVRLIADEVRGSVREAMKSLRADLAAASREEQRERRPRGVPAGQTTRAIGQPRAGAPRGCRDQRVPRPGAQRTALPRRARRRAGGIRHRRAHDLARRRRPRDHPLTARLTRGTRRRSDTDETPSAFAGRPVSCAPQPGQISSSSGTGSPSGTTRIGRCWRCASRAATEPVKNSRIDSPRPRLRVPTTSSLASTWSARCFIAMRRVPDELADAPLDARGHRGARLPRPRRGRDRSRPRCDVDVDRRGVDVAVGVLVGDEPRDVDVDDEQRRPQELRVAGALLEHARGEAGHDPDQDRPAQSVGIGAARAAARPRHPLPAGSRMLRRPCGFALSDAGSERSVTKGSVLS